MKKIHILILFLFFERTAIAQDINWRNFGSAKKNIVNLHTGIDHSLNYGIGYGYKVQMKIPLILNIIHSMPFGDNIVDDFKTKIGIQAEVLHAKNFSTTIKLYGIYRQYKNPFARFSAFGSETSLVSGYYKKKWYVAGEFGFDKSIITHVKHSSLMREYNPELIEGWFIPSGGNFNFGLQTGYNINKNDFTLKFGRVIQQDFKTYPLLPFYFQLGYNRKL